MSSRVYTQVFEFEDNNGIKDKIMLKPLKAGSLKDLFKVVGKLRASAKKPTETEEQFNERSMEVLDSETISILSDLCIETVRNSMDKDTDEDEISYFVTSHFLKLFPVIIDLNFRSGK